MITAKQIVAPAVLGTAAATLYSPPSQTSTVLKKLTFTNNGAGNASVSVYLVPSGGTPGAGNLIRPTRVVAVNECWDCIEVQNHVLPPGASLQAFSSVAAAVTVIASGIEIV